MNFVSFFNFSGFASKKLVPLYLKEASYFNDNNFLLFSCSLDNYHLQRELNKVIKFSLIHELMHLTIKRYFQDTTLF